MTIQTYSNAAKPILQIDKDTNEVIKVWSSLHSIEKAMGIRRKKVLDVCNHLKYKKTAAGFKWQYADEVK